MRNLVNRSTLGLLACLVTAFAASPAFSSVRAVTGGIEFSHTDPAASSVAVAGNFNDWNTTANPMADADGDGTWTVVLPLGPGDYEYKYVVNGGTWVADAGNSRTGGDFGNSLLTVTKDGVAAAPGSSVTAVPSGTPEVSNTPLHSRVYLGGFFRMIMDAVSDVDGDPRLRLQRPNNNFNLDFTANLSERLWGDARLQLKTGEGGANEISADLYKAQANFVDTGFRVQAYYNDEVFETADPFRLLGHIDLRGTIEVENRLFGQGTQGVVFRATPFAGDLSVLYSDTFDEDIFNPSEPTVLNPRKEGLNQATGTDILVGRYQRPVGETTVGISYRGELSDWWVNFTKDENLENGAYPAELAAYRAADPRPDDQKSDNFELANDVQVAAVDLDVPLPGSFRTRAAGAYTWYSARWDLGNREVVQGDGFSNGPVDVPIGDENGWRGKLELAYEREHGRAAVSQEVEQAQGMDADENTVTYRTTPGSTISDRSFFTDVPVLFTYQDVNGSDAVDILRLGPRPERTNYITETDFDYDWRDLRFELEVDRHSESLDYANFDGQPASMDRLAWRFSPRVRYRPFQRKDHHISFETEFWSYSDPRELAQAGAGAVLNPLPGQGTGSLLRVDSNEYIVRGLVPAFKLRERDLSFRFNLRFIEYNGRTDLTTIETDDGGNEVEVPLNLTGDFFSAFVALVYQPADAVQVHVGYGVDPTFYDVISPGGWPNGRQQFRDAYLIERRLDPYNPVNVLTAERALEDRRQLVINAVVTF